MRFLLLLLCLHAAASHAAPRVVTSIVPLQEITASITAGITQPDVIIDGGGDVHHFALRPSHMRLLQQADLVIWIDRGFEGGFYRLAQILPESVSQLELMPALAAHTRDGHIWYSPKLLLQSIEIISRELQRLDPHNSDVYLQNADGLSRSISRWRDDMFERWRQRQPRVVTDHEFLGYLANELQLDHVVALHDRHDAAGGLKDLNRLEERLRENPALCLITLESRPSPLAVSLARKYQLRTISIPSGIDTGFDSKGILLRLDQLAWSLEMCK